MKEPIDNLIRSFNEISVYYDMHGKPADATDIRNVIAEYRKEVKEIANVDICESCEHYMCNRLEYPCSECCHANDMDFYEYRDNWDENGKYINKYR